MYLSDEALAYERQLDNYRLMLNGHPENDGYFHSQAAEMHALVVIDAVQDLRMRAIEVGEVLSGEIHVHLVYGVGRRTGDIWDALRDLVSIAPPDRTAPLSLDQATRASRALNTIYINIRGTLDNVAWALIGQAGGLKAVKLNHTGVDLFGAKFLGVEAFGDLPARLAPFSSWYSDVKDRRNPAAHRIPLAVIPAQVDAAQADEIARLQAEMFAPLRKPDLKPEDLEALKAHQNATRARIEKIGVYRPLFAHLPSEGPIEIYPTVAEDVGQMIRVARVVLDHLRAAQSKSEIDRA